MFNVRVIIGIFLISVWSVCSAEIGQIKTLAGDVHILRDGQQLSASAGDAVKQHDTIVTGNNGSVGKIEDNDELGARRADEVRNLLIELGLEPRMVSAVSRGEREPLVPTGDEIDEPKNRRV